LIEHLDHLRIGLVGPRDRANRSHIYTLDLPVKEWLAYFTANQVRVSPERDGIRVSFGLFNSIEDVDRLADIIQRSNLPRTPRIVASA
jgi:selenocysteine lyase/cysteine desulfurase